MSDLQVGSLVTITQDRFVYRASKATRNGKDIWQAIPVGMGIPEDRVIPVQLREGRYQAVCTTGGLQFRSAGSVSILEKPGLGEACQSCPHQLACIAQTQKAKV